MYFKVVTPSEPVTSLFDVLSWQLAGSDGENMTQEHRNSGASFVKLTTKYIAPYIIFLVDVEQNVIELIS